MAPLALSLNAAPVRGAVLSQRSRTTLSPTLAPRPISARRAVRVCAALERPAAASSAKKAGSRPAEELLAECVKMAEDGTEVVAKFVGKVREGAKVEVNGVEGIIPFKLIDVQTQKVFMKAPDSLKGKEIPCVVTSVDTEKSVVSLDGRKIVEAEKWAAMAEALKNETTFKGTISSAANTGVVIVINGLRAFLPGSRMNLDRYVRFTSDPKSVIGDPVTVLVQKVGDDYSLIVDERSASQKTFIDSHKEGEIVTGKVRKIFDYGVLVNLAAPGSAAQGMIPINELSWEFVATPEQVVQHGDVIQCKIIKLHQNTRRVDLSLKQMEDDPLRETIDKVLPLDESIEWESAAVPVAGLNTIVDELLTEDGVEKVTLGRQALQQRAVSQDMEVYITRCEVEDGFNLVARAGRSLQELHVVTTLDRASMVGALGRVLKRVV